MRHGEVQEVRCGKTSLVPFLSPVPFWVRPGGRGCGRCRAGRGDRTARVDRARSHRSCAGDTARGQLTVPGEVRSLWGSCRAAHICVVSGAVWAAQPRWTHTWRTRADVLPDMLVHLRTLAAEPTRPDGALPAGAAGRRTAWPPPRRRQATTAACARESPGAFDHLLTEAVGSGEHSPHDAPPRPGEVGRQLGMGPVLVCTTHPFDRDRCRHRSLSGLLPTVSHHHHHA